MKEETTASEHHYDRNLRAALGFLGPLSIRRAIGATTLALYLLECLFDNNFQNCEMIRGRCERDDI